MAKTILIVDDDTSVRVALGRMLSSMGYETRLADGGKTALLILSERTVDLVLTDFEMPKMNGVELVSELYNLGYRIPVVMLTASPGSVPNTRRITATIGKPIEMEELQAALEFALKA